MISRIFLILFSVLFLVLELEISFAEQTTLVSTDVNCPLEISEFQVLKISTNNVSAGTNSKIQQIGNGSRIDTSEGPITQNLQQSLAFTFKAKNTNNQPISCFYWESRYISVEHKLMIKQFKTKKNIKPNKEVLIKENLPLDIKCLPAEAKLGYRITKIEYDNKTVWTAPVHNNEGVVYITINFSSP